MVGQSQPIEDRGLRAIAAISASLLDANLRLMLLKDLDAALAKRHVGYDEAWYVGCECKRHIGPSPEATYLGNGPNRCGNPQN